MPLKSLARYNVQHLRFRRSVPFILAGAVHDIQTNDSRDTGMSRLRRPSDLCSSTLSDTAYRLGHGSTPCFPTVEKILCHSPISERSPVSGLRQTMKQRETGVKRVETAGVCPLALAAGAAIGYISPPTYNRSREPLQYGSGPPANPQFLSADGGYSHPQSSARPHSGVPRPFRAAHRVKAPCRCSA